MSESPSADAPYNTLTPDSARMIYSFQMAGQIARLFLFLFGEFEKETIRAITDTILKEGLVVERIVRREGPPLRLIYEELVSRGLIEEQNLSAEAMLYIDMPDNLQMRITDQPPKAPEQFVPDDWPEETE